ncbi:hypothetical protein DFH09DRAFT_986964 [Mycena vulgaris]|nr:hypothetical protein DFH09DRAFT_986964 [Mycena vulgaris]
MSTEVELKKLTVPQLKALCKEKRITGYSKLGKDAIIQKLLGTAMSTASSSAAQTAAPAPDNTANIPSPSEPHAPPTPTVPAGDLTPPNPPEIPPDSVAKPKKRKNPPASHESLTVSTSTGVFKVPAVPQRLQDPAVAHSTLPDTSSTSAPPKKKKKVTAEPPTPNSAAHDTTPASTTSVPKKKKKTAVNVPISSTANTSAAPKKPKKITPEVPTNVVADETVPSSTTAAPKKRTTITAATPPKTSAGPDVIPTQPISALNMNETVPADVPILPTKRFVPLVVHAKKLPVPAPAVMKPPSSTVAIVAKSSLVGTLYHLDFPTSPPPISLSAITLPPSLSQRKRIPRFSLLLSCVADEDLRNCVLVSRMFRYAVYLSAFHRLARNFAGKRLSMMLVKHSQTMTNMWPYLEQRTREATARKQRYYSSFLGALFPRDASNPISEHLWTSPDHERQIVIAIRFLLTRLFFQVSVGGGKDGKGWTEGQIVDAQQLVQNEIWMITVRHSATSTESFYILEPTCEPLTATPESASPGLPVRADWSAYIAHRTSADGSPSPRLLDHLSWTNHEEYQLGISRLWLKRIEAEGETGIAKRITAERYILACVVGNRRVLLLSGRWMSSTQMAQDFAGLPDGASARVKASPKVNLFLPAHHHVESLHFTAPARAGMRRELHGALAVVQTPGREYFILRDNGMQVGCEEEGVAEVWMNIFGCDNSGVAASLA